MKLFFRIIFKIFLILTILAGCATTEEIKETDPVALLDQSEAFIEKDQYDRAIANCNKAIEINPRLAKAYYNRGVGKFNLKDYQGAEQNLRAISGQISLTVHDFPTLLGVCHCTGATHLQTLAPADCEWVCSDSPSVERDWRKRLDELAQVSPGGEAARRVRSLSTRPCCDRRTRRGRPYMGEEPVPAREPCRPIG